MTTIREGDLVLLRFNGRREYVVKVVKGRRFETDRGYIELDSLIGLTYGTTIKTNLGYKVLVLKPLPSDLIGFFERRTQIIYPKDLAFIVYLSGVSSGSIVVEAGTGSGVLTATLAYYVRPDGKVYTYEVRREFLEIARRNILRAKLADYVVFKNKDVGEGIDERNVDAVFFDLPNPWNYINIAYEALKPSAPLIIFLPTVSQVEKTLTAIYEHKGYTEPKVYEILLREYKSTPGELRPETWMIGHTGYIVFTRKIIK